MLKRILNNYRIQLLLGLITGVLGSIIFYVLMVIYWIKYSGFSFLDIGSSGDKSPITFAFATIFTILTFTFPTLVWYLLNRFGNLKSVSKKTRIITIILFVTLPFWTYIGSVAYAKLQNTYSDYRMVRDDCINKNGVNKLDIGKNKKEIECKNGILNGFTKIFNSKGVLIYEGIYLNGKLNGTENVFYDEGNIKISTEFRNGEKEGTEIFYNENGSTSLYILNNPGKSNQIYFQIPEKYLDSEVSPESQNFFCKNQEKYLSKNYKYSCLNNLVNGDFIKNDSGGNILLKVNISNGVLNGIYEQFSYGILNSHLEFKYGILDGKVYAYSTSGSLEYEGQYINGLQDGVFRRYDFKGNVESEVVFENGRIVKINSK